MSRLANRTPDEALSLGSSSLETKRSPAGSPRSIEEYRADLRALHDAGLDVVEYEGAALVGGAYLVDEATSTYETITEFGVRSSPYRSSGHLVAEYLNDEWNAIEASRSAVLRERKLDRRDDARRVLYEAYVDGRVARGDPLPDGGIGAPCTSSGFHGVAWTPSVRRWAASVLRPQIPGLPSRQSCRRAGFFESPIEAALAFDRMNVLMRGRYARTNFPVGSVFVPDDDGGRALPPDGSRLEASSVDVQAVRRRRAALGIDGRSVRRRRVAPLADCRVVRRFRHGTDPMTPYWEERFPDVDPLSMPKRHRTIVLTLHEASRDYHGLVAFQDGEAILAELCIPSIEHFVDVMNAFRRKRMRTPVERREFPTDRARLQKLAKEYRAGHRKVVPHPSRRPPSA